MNTEAIEGATILIVDDNPSNLATLFACLNKFKPVLRIAQTGEDALELVKEIKPDIILLDILMPGIDGFETCRQLKKNEDTRDIPVLFISSLSETVDKVEGFEVGGVDYITKPFQIEEVTARITTHLNIQKLKNSLQEKNILLSQEVKERRRAESLLWKAKLAAEASSRAKSEFIARMSHEILTPMNAIIGMNHLALQTELSAKQRDYLTKIRASACSLLELITNILDFSELETEKLEIKFMNFYLDEVMTNLLDRIRSRTEEKKLEICFKIGKNVPLGLNGDPTRLEQILTNLADNAVKFTEKGKILLRAGVGDNRDTIPGQIILEFSVQDSGIGISPDSIPEIFDAFTQTDGSITRKYGGTGLGLAICKHLTELMGGQIWVKDNSPEPGSTFYFTAIFGIQPEERQSHRSSEQLLRICEDSVPCLYDADQLADIHPLLNELDVLLGEGNSEASDYINTVQPHLKTVGGIEAEVQLLEDQVSNYDFEDARETLTRIRKSLGISLKG
jgi:signal transduction histidine kinase